MNAKMKKHTPKALALTMILLGLGAASSSLAQPQAEITMSPMHGYAAGPSGLDAALIVAGPDINSSILRVDPTEIVEEGDFQWVNFPFTTALYAGGVVTAVVVCYDIDATVQGTSYISQIRLTDTVAPPSSSVVMDDPTDRTEIEPGCHTVDDLSVSPDGILNLAVKVVFGSTDDSISFGMVRYVVRRQPQS